MKIQLKNGEVFAYNIIQSTIMTKAFVEIEIPFIGNQVIEFQYTDDKDLDFQVSQFIVSKSPRIYNEIKEIEDKEYADQLDKQKQEEWNKQKENFVAIINFTTEDDKKYMVLHEKGSTDRDTMLYNPERGDIGFYDIEEAKEYANTFNS